MEALKREMLEEMGVKIEVSHLACVVDNFFTLDGKRYQQLGLYFEVHAPEDAAIYVCDRFEGVEENTKLVFRWFEIEELAEVDLRPAVLAGVLTETSDTLVYLTQVGSESTQYLSRTRTSFTP